MKNNFGFQPKAGGLLRAFRACVAGGRFAPAGDVPANGVELICDRYSRIPRIAAGQRGVCGLQRDGEDIGRVETWPQANAAGVILHPGQLQQHQGKNGAQQSQQTRIRCEYRTLNIIKEI